MNKLVRIKGLQTDAQGIFNNIEWNFGGLAGMVVLTANPKLFYLPNVPMRIEIEGLALDGFQCLGIALQEKDRPVRVEELLSLARRSLICEALELSADFLTRAARISTSGDDPYETDDYFSANIRELWTTTTGRAGSLIGPVEREFFEKCAAPLRHFIRHNNGKLPPNKCIIYSGKPRAKLINLSFQWKKDEDNTIKLPLPTAHDIFATIRDVAQDALQQAVVNAESIATKT